MLRVFDSKWLGIAQLSNNFCKIFYYLYLSKHSIAIGVFNVAVAGGWSKYGPFTECSVTCGNGSRSRDRLCEGPWDCIGEYNETEVCSDKECGKQ